jgi:hypothetical protein
MSFLEQLFGAGAGGVGDLVKKVVGTFKLDPTVKAQIESQLEQNKFDLEKMDKELEQKIQDYNAKEIEEAGETIRAEAQSGDKFTSRARPTFMYLIEAILGFNYIVIPFAKIVHLSSLDPIALPTNLLTLFGVCITGYVGFRSVDKALNLSGDSQVSLGPIKLLNKR